MRITFVACSEQATAMQEREPQAPRTVDVPPEPTPDNSSNQKLRAVLSSDSLSSEPGANRQTDSCDEDDLTKRDDDSQKELIRAQHVFNFRRKKLEDSQSVSQAIVLRVVCL